uniref:GLABRA2 expression modulator n=1 Tax=Anthurium amnicola TaxID=1678845 RepID=A0A1D1YXF6_9ARAE
MGGHQQEQQPTRGEGGGGEGGDARWGTWVMGTPVPPQAHPANQQAASSDPAHVDRSSCTSHPPPAVHAAAASSSFSAYGNNPYVQVSPAPGSPGKGPMETILKALGRCGKKLEDTTKRAGGAAENIWHHLRTSPSLTDAAMARLSQGTKVLAEGGHDKIFQQLFGVFPGEQLRKAYACYLSTSSGPVIGTLYLSNTRMAFCSDNPLCHSPAPGQQEWIYYKVVVQLNQVMAVTPSANRMNPSERYIQVLTADGHEFWFMGFVSYDKAVKNLTEALQHQAAR